MKKILVAICLVSISLTAKAAQSPDFKVSCRVFGLLNQEEWKYQTIVEGDLDVVSSQLKAKPRTKDGGCEPVEVRSKIFGQTGGTTLEFIASKCGSDKIYVIPRITLNGLPILAPMGGNSSRITFNEDASETKDQPLNLAEGSYKFIYADCKKTALKR